ncbi:MAG: histidine kinase N-terminal 7TM domain-containing protein, partial [Saccharofermentanales bacterium]
MKYAFVLSITFYVCSCFYAIFGAYLIVNNENSKANRLFVLLTSSMAIWSFAYSIANSVPTAEENAFWRCISVFGWGVFYSILLHFILVLTNTEERLNKRCMLVVLYLPAVINIILYAPFGYLAEKQYEVVQTDFGWIDKLPIDMGKLWINLYPIIFVIPSILLLIRWRGELEPHSLMKRQATIFLITVLFPFFVGGLTDILPDILGIEAFPKVAVIFITIPVTMLFLASKRYGVFLEKSKEVIIYRETEEVTGSSRLRLFETAAAIFSIGALGSFLTGYFIAGGNLAHEFSLALVVFILGTFLSFIPHIVKKHTVQNTLFLITGIAGMSAFIIGNIDTGAVTVWAVYIIFLLYTVVLNSDIHTIIFMVATLIIQFVLGIIHPEVNVIIDSAQYLKRIFIIVLSYYAVRYLTAEYASKLKGYQRFVQEQEVLERISTSFISVSSESAKETTYKMLEMSSEILGFNHAYIIEFDEDYEDATILNTCVKSVKSGSFPFYTGMKVKTATLPMSQSLITHDAPVTGEDFNDLAADEAAEQRDFFLSRGVHSFCALPIPVDKQVKAILVVEYYDRIDKSIRERQLYFLKMMTNILGDAKQKALYEEMLYDYAYFDETTKLANRNMLKKI